jgi:hypothetical protein
MEEGCQTLEAYCIDLEDLFYSRYEMTRQAGVLKDVVPIVIRKTEVTTEVWPNPLHSLDDVQSMINSALERQAKSSDKLVHRLIEERDRKILIDYSFNPSSSSCTVNFTQTNAQMSGTSVGITIMPNPSTQLMNHFYSRTTMDGLAPAFEIL